MTDVGACRVVVLLRSDVTTNATASEELIARLRPDLREAEFDLLVGEETTGRAPLREAMKWSVERPPQKSRRHRFVSYHGTELYISVGKPHEEWRGEARFDEGAADVCSRLAGLVERCAELDCRFEVISVDELSLGYRLIAFPDQGSFRPYGWAFSIELDRHPGLAQHRVSRQFEAHFVVVSSADRMHFVWRGTPASFWSNEVGPRLIRDDLISYFPRRDPDRVEVMRTEPYRYGRLLDADFTDL